MCSQSRICNIFTSKFLVTLYNNSLIAPFFSGNFKHGGFLKRHLYLEGHKSAVTQVLQKHDLYIMFSAYVQTYNSSLRAMKNIYLLEAVTVSIELCSCPIKRQIKTMWALTISVVASLCLSSCLVFFMF